MVYLLTSTIQINQNVREIHQSHGSNGNTFHPKMQSSCTIWRTGSKPRGKFFKHLISWHLDVVRSGHLSGFVRFTFVLVGGSINNTPTRGCLKQWYFVMFQGDIKQTQCHEKKPALLSIESWLFKNGILISWFTK